MEQPFEIRDEHGARPTLVICPECNQPGFVDVWPWILSTRDEKAVKLLLDGDLFKYRCPVCDVVTTFAYDCMYHDPLNRVLLEFSSGKHSEEQCRKAIDKLADSAQWKSGSQTPAYRKRIVMNPYEFYEKARLFSRGYDDRVIELMKVALKRGMLREGIIGRNDTMVYERTMEDGGISFIVFGEIPGDVVGVKKGYEFLEKLLRDSDADFSGEYRFGKEWAEAFLP